MSDYTLTKQTVRLRCEECDKVNYHTRRNKKQVKEKLEFKKFCRWCRKHTLHKESKR